MNERQRQLAADLDAENARSDRNAQIAGWIGAAIALGLLGVMTAEMYPNHQYERAHCELTMSAYVCRTITVAEYHRGEVVVDGENYTLTYRPRVDMDTMVQIEPKRLLGFIRFGDGGGINQAVTNLEVRGCRFSRPPFNGERADKVYKVVVKHDFPDSDMVVGAYGFVENGSCLPRPAVDQA